jgi:hypothetical protein
VFFSFRKHHVPLAFSNSSSRNNPYQEKLKKKSTLTATPIGPFLYKRNTGLLIHLNTLTATTRKNKKNMKVALLVIVAWLSVSISRASEPLPNVNYIIDGFNVREFESKGYAEAARNPIFLPTYDLHQEYTPPKSNITYRLPDQIGGVDYIGSTIIKRSTDIYDHEERFIQEETSSFEFDLGFDNGKIGVEASYNKTIYHIHSIFKQDFAFAAKGYVRSTMYKYKLGPYILFQKHPFFQGMLNRIPSCPRTPEDLKNVDIFIRAYGHVFPTDIILGGTEDTLTTIDKHIFQEYEKSWVYEQLSLTFTYKNWELDAGGFDNKSDIHIAKDFAQAARTTQLFQGGDRKYQLNSTLKPWFESINDYPNVIGGTFLPLSELIENDPVKAQSLHWLLSQHISNGNITYPPCAYLVQVQKETLPSIQGYAFIGSGYNTRTLRPRSAILQLGFTLGKTWQNPFYKEYKYAVPDQVVVDTFTESIEQNETRIAMNKMEFESLVRSESHDSDWFGSHSSEMICYNRYYSHTGEFLFHHTRQLSWYKMQLSPLQYVKPNYNGWFARYLNLLGGVDINTQEGKRLFYRFFEAYGDAVIVGVTMGGRITFRNWIHFSVLETMSRTEIHTHSSNSFFGVIGTKEDYDYYQMHASRTFTSGSHIELKVEGGEHNPFKYPIFNGYYQLQANQTSGPLLNWNDYAKTIKNALTPVNIKTVPISQFITDGVLRVKMETMLKEYWTQK